MLARGELDRFRQQHDRSANASARSCDGSHEGPEYSGQLVTAEAAMHHSDMVTTPLPTSLARVTLSGIWVMDGRSLAFEALCAWVSLAVYRHIDHQ